MSKIWPVIVAEMVIKDLESCMNDLAQSQGDEQMAEDTWNDPDVLYDMLGGRITERLTPYKLKGIDLEQGKNMVARAIEMLAHPALVKAAERIGGGQIEVCMCECHIDSFTAPSVIHGRTCCDLQDVKYLDKNGALILDKYIEAREKVDGQS